MTKNQQGYPERVITVLHFRRRGSYFIASPLRFLKLRADVLLQGFVELRNLGQEVIVEESDSGYKVLHHFFWTPQVDCNYDHQVFRVLLV